MYILIISMTRIPPPFNIKINLINLILVKHCQNYNLHNIYLHFVQQQILKLFNGDFKQTVFSTLTYLECLDMLEMYCFSSSHLLKDSLDKIANPLCAISLLSRLIVDPHGEIAVFYHKRVEHSLPLEIL